MGLHRQHRNEGGSCSLHQRTTHWWTRGKIAIPGESELPIHAGDVAAMAAEGDAAASLVDQLKTISSNFPKGRATKKMQKKTPGHAKALTLVVVEPALSRVSSAASTRASAGSSAVTAWG